METNADFYQLLFGSPPPFNNPPEFFWNLIIDTTEKINKRLKISHHQIPDEPLYIIQLSYFFTPLNEWSDKLTHLKAIAFRFFTTPATLWTTIATGLYTPEVGEAYRKIKPTFDPERYLHKTSTTPAPQKIGPELITAPKKKRLPKRGILWKLDRRWDPLWPSSRKIFDELLSRATYGKRSPRFPWAYGGLKSLEEKTGNKNRQIRKALHQLQGLSMIKRIFRAYEGQGASKYWVFFTPKMSGAFYRLTIPPKKRRS